MAHSSLRNPYRELPIILTGCVVLTVLTVVFSLPVMNLMIWLGYSVYIGAMGTSAVGVLFGFITLRVIDKQIDGPSTFGGLLNWLSLLLCALGISAGAAPYVAQRVMHGPLSQFSTNTMVTAWTAWLGLLTILCLAFVWGLIILVWHWEDSDSS